MDRLVSEKISIVLVGSMNPAIFHPSWFAKNGLIAEEYDNSENGNYGATADLCQFQLPDDIVIRVFRNKFIAETSLKTSLSIMNDLVIQTFKILSHVPVERMGLNVDRVHQAANGERWTAIGRSVAPTSIWERVYPYLPDLDEEKQQALGLWTQTMQIPREDELEGNVYFKVAVAHVKERKINLGVNNDISINDLEEALTILEDRGEGMINQAIEKIELFLDQIGKEE